MPTAREKRIDRLTLQRILQEHEPSALDSMDKLLEKSYEHPKGLNPMWRVCEQRFDVDVDSIKAEVKRTYARDYSSDDDDVAGKKKKTKDDIDAVDFETLRRIMIMSQKPGDVPPDDTDIMNNLQDEDDDGNLEVWENCKRKSFVDVDKIKGEVAKELAASCADRYGFTNPGKERSAFMINRELLRRVCVDHARDRLGMIDELMRKSQDDGGKRMCEEFSGKFDVNISSMTKQIEKDFGLGEQRIGPTGKMAPNMPSSKTPPSKKVPVWSKMPPSNTPAPSKKMPPSTNTPVSKKQPAEIFEEYLPRDKSSSTISKIDAFAALSQYYPHETPIRALELIEAETSSSSSEVTKQIFVNITSQIRPPPPTPQEFCDIVARGNLTEVKRAVEIQGFDVAECYSASAPLNNFIAPSSSSSSSSSGDQQQRHPISICASKNYIDILLYLLRKGADVSGGGKKSDDVFSAMKNTSSSNKTKILRPLFVAVSISNLDAVRILLSHGADPTAIAPEGKTTAIHFSAFQSGENSGESPQNREKQIQILKALIEKVPSQEKFGLIKDDMGSTVLHSAVYGGSLEAVKIVLKNLRSVYARTERNSENQTPLEVAQSEGYDKEMIDALKHYGLSNDENAAITMP